jgi:hypothetical protein
MSKLSVYSSEALKGRESIKAIRFRGVNLSLPEQHTIAVRCFLRRTPHLKVLIFYSCYLSLDSARVVAEGLREGRSLLERFIVFNSLSPGRRIARSIDATLRRWQFNRASRTDGADSGVMRLPLPW